MTEIRSRSSSRTSSTSSTSASWNRCQHCYNHGEFSEPQDFIRHLRSSHCSKEGGSYVCRYGYNGVCSSLPLEGVSDKDYEDHVVKHHALTMYTKGSSGGMVSGGREVREEKWGVYSSTQNVAAVLNDPRKGMKRDFFTKTWGESFVDQKDIPPHVALPEVTTRHVESYVRRLRKRQKMQQRLAALEASKEIQEKEEASLGPSERVSEGMLGATDEIPAIYLSGSFNLEDPETFHSVFTHITDQGISQKNSKLLQEKMFHYVEKVEVDMSRQISLKSSAFFETMMYLNAQMKQLELNHTAVSKLRKCITSLREESVVTPMRNLKLPRRRTNIQETVKKLEVMSSVREVQTTIQVMLARQEYTGALDLISTTQDLLSTEISTIRCLKNLSSELSEHEKLIDKMVSAEFVKYISEDLHRPVEDTRPLLEEDQLIGVVFSVLRLRKFDFLDALREEAYAAIKATVKQAVVESISEVEVDTANPSVADQAKVLAIASWLTLLSTTTSRLNIVIDRVKVMIDVMLQAVEASAGHSNPTTNGGAGHSNPTTDGVQAASLVTLSSSGVEAMLDSAAYTRAQKGLKEVICATCDYAHDRCAKLLHARSKDHGLDKMTASEFLMLSRIIENFVADTEKVCGRKSTTFRMGLQGQATRFVSRFHEERDARLKLNLGSERWRPVPAPPDLQRLMDHIVSTDTLVFPPDPVENGNHTKENGNSIANNPVSEVGVNKGNNSSTNTVTQNGLQSFSSSSSLNTMAESNGVMVHGEEYVVVGVCVVVVRLIVEYSECATKLSLAAHQLLTRLTDLLRKFNSDTCRLLIEAGAVALGLKTITTRNLALAWRSLQLLLTLLPRLKTHFSALLRPAIVEKNIDQLTREYKEHCQAIENKIVGVVSDLIDRHLAIWEARSPVPSASFNGILRATSKLHEAVSGVLSRQQELKLFEKVTSVLKEKLKVHLVRLNVSSVGPQSWVVTSELTFYFNHIESLGQGSLSQEDFTRDLWPQKTPS